MNEARAETGGPNRTPRSEIHSVVSVNRNKEPVLLLDLSTSMNWGAADEYDPEWPDAGSRRAIVIEALHGLVRVLEHEDSEAADEQAGGDDEPVSVWDHVKGRAEDYLSEYGRPDQIAAWRDSKPYVAALSENSAGR